MQALIQKYNPLSKYSDECDNYVDLIKLVIRKYSYFLHFWLFGRDMAILSKMKNLNKIGCNFEKNYIFKVNNSVSQDSFFQTKLYVVYQKKTVLALKSFWLKNVIFFLFNKTNFYRCRHLIKDDLGWKSTFEPSIPCVTMRLKA